MFRREHNQGPRELRAAVMKQVAQDYVRFLISDAATTYLSAEMGITATDQITAELMDEATQAVQDQVLESLRPKEGDSPDRRRYAAIIARSLAGFGDRIAPDVLTTNEGDPRLVSLQSLFSEAINDFS